MERVKKVVRETLKWIHILEEQEMNGFEEDFVLHLLKV
jgi:hypothetical protein